MRIGWSILLWCACAPPDPRPTLDAYAAAIKSQDAGALARLSEGGLTEAQLAELLEDPEVAEEALGRLSGPLALSTYAEAVAADGRRVRLVLGPRGWRVAEGGLEPISDTPERALNQFIAAADKRDLGSVRRAIPEAQRASMDDDARLLGYLEALGPRLHAARLGLAKVAPASARIEGELAYLDYGPGRTVRFRREAGRWRILDLE